MLSIESESLLLKEKVFSDENSYKGILVIEMLGGGWGFWLTLASATSR
jgi:hypothetical protein